MGEARGSRIPVTAEIGLRRMFVRRLNPRIWADGALVWVLSGGKTPRLG